MSPAFSEERAWKARTRLYCTQARAGDTARIAGVPLTASGELQTQTDGQTDSRRKDKNKTETKQDRQGTRDTQQARDERRDRQGDEKQGTAHKTTETEIVEVRGVCACVSRVASETDEPPTATAPP